jgi:site-specific recombinase XerD
MTIEQVTRQYLNHHRALGSSPKTIAHYDDSVRIFELFLEHRGSKRTVDELTTATFQAFSAYLRETPSRPWRGSTIRSSHSIHGILKDWRAICRWAHEERLLEALPKVPVPKLPQRLFPILTEEELATIFASRQLDDRTEIGKRNRALFAFMLDTGVRLGEVTSLQLADVDLRQLQAKVRGKGNKERMVFFSDGVEETLKKWLMVRGSDPGSLFWLAPMGVSMVLKRIRDETGIKLLHAHQIRHTAATMMVRQRADLHTIKRILGHQQLSTVEIYLSLDNQDLQGKHATSSPFEKLRDLIEPEPIRGRRRLRSS